MKGTRTRLFFFALLCVFSAFSQAAVVVDKQPNPGTSFGGLNSNAGLDFERMADDFSLNSATEINTVSWYGWYFGGGTTGDFDILFYNDSSNLPGNPPFYTTSVSGVAGVSTGITTDFGSTVLRWTASITTATFSGAGDYWISVQGRGADVSDIDTIWVWAFADADPISGESGAAFQDEGTIEWEAFSASDAQHLTDAFAFTLDTAVIPVPAALPLLGSALAGLGFMGWRRSKML